MKIILIAAIDQNSALGVDGDMAWNLPADFKHFKNSTLGKTIVMGHKTAVSIKSALPKRDNWVLSRTRQAPYDNMRSFRNIDEVLAAARAEGLEELWIVGGGEIYKQFMDVATDLIITHIHGTASHADVFFPHIDMGVWDGTLMFSHPIDAKNAMAFDVIHWQASGSSCPKETEGAYP